MFGCLTFLSLMAIGLFSYVLFMLRPDTPDTSQLDIYGYSLKGGVIPASIADQHLGQSHIFVEGPVSDKGHRYVSLNALPCVTLSQHDALERVAENLPLVFPIPAPGVSGNDVRGNTGKGNEFILGAMPIFGGNPVTSTGLGLYGFLLTATPDHTLRGSAFHGIVADARGHLWLFQVGRGLEGWANEEEWRQELNLVLANDMWERMAFNITRMLTVPGQPCNPNDYVMVPQ
jgi:hypothetical protein